MTLANETKEFVDACFQASGDLSAIKELTSPTCIHQTEAATCIGTDSLSQVIADWIHAFPDFRTDVLDIKTYDNIAVAKTQCTGEHAFQYPTRIAPSTILSRSNFTSYFSDTPPTGNRYDVGCEMTFAFHENTITNVIFETVEDQLCDQLCLERPTTWHSSTEDRFQLISATLIRTLNVALSAREVECLSLAIAGLSAKYASTILGISHRTIESHLCRVYEKLGCYSKQHAFELMHANKTLTQWWELATLLCAKGRQ